jgi:hypothetical protein
VFGEWKSCKKLDFRLLDEAGMLEHDPGGWNVEEAIKRWSEEFYHVVLHTSDIYTRRQIN